jgi:hypothetical protein
MPFDLTLSTLKKPENYPSTSGLGTAQARSLKPSEVHENLVLLAKASGTQETRTTANTYSALDGDRFVMMNNTGACDLNIVAGATVAGTLFVVVARNTGAVTVTTAASTTLTMPVRGTIALVWDGAAWQMLSSGGAGFRVIFTSGAAATWRAPATGTYDVTVIGGGGGGGGARVQGGSSSITAYAGRGGNGGASKRLYRLSAGQVCTYTAGAGGTAGASTPTNGTAGGTSSFTDGTTAISCTGGGLGAVSHLVWDSGSGYYGGLNPGADGANPNGSNGEINGNSSSLLSYQTPAPSANANGIAGVGYGMGGSGGIAILNTMRTGGAGSAGAIIIEW